MTTVPPGDGPASGDGPAPGGKASAGVPSCYRHPARPTRISCSRCGRPICPECMIDASVGFHCPDCVAMGRSSVREPRTAFGGRIAARPRAVPGLIVANVAVFGLTVASAGRVLSGQANSTLVRRFGLQPDAIADGEWWRLVTATFLHAGLLHLALNMWALWLLGSELERYLGTARFLSVYLVSGFAGAVASYWFLPVGGLSVGASGAVFGVLGSFVVVHRRLQRDMRDALVLVVVLLLPGFLLPGIDVAAHLGGLVGGALVTLPMAYAPTGRHRTATQAVGVVCVLALLVGLAMMRTAALTP